MFALRRLLSVLKRRHADLFTKALDEVAGRVEAAHIRNIQHGEQRVREKKNAFLQPVIREVGEDGAAVGGLEQTAALAFADMDLFGNIIEGEPLAVMLVQEAEDCPGFVALVELRRNKGSFAAPQQQMPHSQKPAVCLQLIAEVAVLQNAEQLADLREQKLILAVGGKSDHLHLRVLEIGQEVFLFDDASVKEREQGRLHVEREVAYSGVVGRDMCSMLELMKIPSRGRRV